MDLLKIVCTILIIVAPFNFISGILCILDERKIFKKTFYLLSVISLLLIFIIGLITDIFKYILAEPTIGAVVIAVLSIIIFINIYLIIEEFKNKKGE